VRSLAIPFLLLAVGCKTFGADNTEPDAAAEVPDASLPPCPNGALSFDGKAFVNVAFDPAFDSPSDLTVEAWILPDAAIGDTVADIVSHHDANNSDGWELLFHKGLTFNVYAGPGQGNVATATDLDLTLGTWHHVAAVFDGAAKSITLFIDGKTKGRNIRDKTKADPYSGPLTIGAAAYLGTNGFIGLIDEVRVSRTIRYSDAADFTPAYPLPDNESGTIGTWHFPTSAPVENVADDATGKFKSTLATFATPTPSYPTVAKKATCPTGARP
jgi:hypothetical protein